VWIEGADDLTPEAQAFLRRILETASTPVQCILECRDPQRITPAIQSRCEWKQPPVLASFRKQSQIALVGASSASSASASSASASSASASASSVQANPSTSCYKAFYAAEQPIETLQGFLKGDLWEDALLALKSIGAGSSPWAHLFHIHALQASASASASASAREGSAVT